MMKKILNKFTESIGIKHIGIAPPGPYPDLEIRLGKRISEGKYTGMEESDIEKRIDAHKIMEEAQSVIVALFPYFSGDKEGSNLSNYTYSIDYHRIIKNKFDMISDFLSERIEGFKYKSFVDNGPLVERHMAYLAGLGYFGLNNQLITEEYGSYVFIGYIINNYPFEIDKPLKRTCIGCKECITKCPGQALRDDYDMNPKYCASYITQKKGILSTDEINIIKKGKKIFGCDICQSVCPHNKNIKNTDIKDFTQKLMYNIGYDDMQGLSNKGFKKKYGDRAFSWRGKNIITRNLDIIYNNE